MDDGRCTASAAVGGSVRERQYAGDKPETAAGPLEQARGRILDMCTRMSATARNLEAHANRVHGSEPPAPTDDRHRGSEAQIELPSLAAVFHALDALDVRFQDLAYQAERNMQLA